MSQTVVAEQAAAFAGMKGDSRDDLVVSAVAEGAVPFGKLVSRGTALEKQGILPTGAGDLDAKRALGISIQTHAIESGAPGSGDPSYLDEQIMSVLRRGSCFVKVEETVTVDSDVFVRVSAGGDGVGSFRASDPGGSAALQVTFAKFVRGAAAGELAEIEINLEG